MKNKFLKLSLIPFLFTLFIMVVAPVFVSVTHAEEKPTATVVPKGTAGSYELISPIGNISSIKDQDPAGLSGFINLLIKIAIAMAGAIAVVIIIINGIQYMGTGSVWEKGESKAKMGTAIGGIILLLCSYIILYTINPDLVNIKIGIGKGTEGEWKYEEKTDYDATPTSSAAECTGGLVKIPDNIDRKPDVDNFICKELAEKITLLKSNTKLEWVITATTNGKHASQCHKKNTKKTGACLDIALREKGNTVPADDLKWGTFCEEVNAIQGIDFLNEASKTPKCVAIHPNKSTDYGTGPHLHIIYTGK